jgi:glutaryl-CoA dehydrogenase (non-decarboxylating)
MARDFTKGEILPNIERWEREGRWPKEVVAQMGGLGFFGAVIPQTYGGTDAGYLCHALIVEEITRGTPIFSSAFNVQGASVPKAILTWGTEEQKRRYVEAMVKGELIGCHAITEPGAGSDVAGIQMTAIKDGDAYILRGTKMWITYAPVADLALVFAKTMPQERHKGISAFLVPTHLPGLTIREMHAISGSNCLPTGEMIFEDCRLPTSGLLGPENSGFRVAMKMLDSTRITIPARCIGVAQACIDASVRYANERYAFGQAIGHYQMIKADLAEMIARTEAGRMLVYRLAWLVDQGEPSTLEGSITKLYCGELAFWVASRAQFIHGAYGFHREFAVARLLSEAQFMRIAEGTSNIHRLIIADDALGYKKANRTG